MELGLGNRIVLVAGSSRGIGLAIAKSFLAEGCRTVITGRSLESLGKAEADLTSSFGADRVLAIQADMTSIAAVRDVLARINGRWGLLQAVVANVGTGRGNAGWQLDDTEWARLFDTNFFGATRLVAEALPQLITQGAGSVTLVSSIAGIEASPAPLPYSAAKAALVNYTRNLARQIGTTGVRVNCVAPGNVLFQGGSWERRLTENLDAVTKFIESEVSLQRFGRVEEIADVVVFLASDRAAFMTGACVVVDGGQTRGV